MYTYFAGVTCQYPLSCHPCTGREAVNQIALLPAHWSTVIGVRSLRMMTGDSSTLNQPRQCHPYTASGLLNFSVLFWTTFLLIRPFFRSRSNWHDVCFAHIRYRSVYVDVSDGLQCEDSTAQLPRKRRWHVFRFLQVRPPTLRGSHTDVFAEK